VIGSGDFLTEARLFEHTEWRSLGPACHVVSHAGVKSNMSEAVFKVFSTMWAFNSVEDQL